MTGGASGIGAEVAARLAGAGARVLIGDLDGDAAAARAAELPTASRGSAVDVADDQSVRAWLADAGTSAGVVHCAGTGGMPAPVTDTDAEMWRHVVDVNLTGSMLVLKHAAPIVRDGGSLIAVSSLNGTQPGIGMGAYCASKAAVEMLVRVAALELAPRGVRVNAIAPGLIDTPLSAPLTQPGLVDEYLDNTPVRRVGTTRDVADAATFLLSDAAACMTGETLAVDGGAHMRRDPNILAHLSGDVVAGR